MKELDEPGVIYTDMCPGMRECKNCLTKRLPLKLEIDGETFKPGAPIVMHTPAGWYIGRADDEGPFCRATEYMSKEKAHDVYRQLLSRTL